MGVYIRILYRLRRERASEKKMRQRKHQTNEWTERKKGLERHRKKNITLFLNTSNKFVNRYTVIFVCVLLHFCLYIFLFCINCIFSAVALYFFFLSLGSLSHLLSSRYLFDLFAAASSSKELPTIDVYILVWHTFTIVTLLQIQHNWRNQNNNIKNISTQ